MSCIRAIVLPQSLAHLERRDRAREQVRAWWNKVGALVEIRWPEKVVRGLRCIGARRETSGRGFGFIEFKIAKGTIPTAFRLATMPRSTGLRSGDVGRGLRQQRVPLPPLSLPKDPKTRQRPASRCPTTQRPKDPLILTRRWRRGERQQRVPLPPLSLPKERQWIPFGDHPLMFARCRED